MPQPTPNWRDTLLAPIAAGVATLCASTSLTAVVGGLAWFGYLFVAVLLIAATGLALRALQTPTVLVGLAQLLVLLFLITGAFTAHGILYVIPGPEALGELRDTLAASADQIRTGLPPVAGTPPILCLVTIAIGLVAVLVDTLAVAAAAPAATGLVLLCVYAVPAALADEMLPWWTFLFGAAAFAALLAVDGNHRHRRWRTRDAPGSGSTASLYSAPVAVVSAAIVLGLLGGAISWVGTVGKIPFGNGGGAGRGAGGFGIQPFTELRGLLDQGQNAELFQVRGLNQTSADKRLLRAFTLDTYVPNKGWQLHDEGRSQQGVPADKPLPPAPGDDGTGPARDIQIQPTNWVDNWLPVYGAPRKLTGISGEWLYDQVGGAVFTTRSEAAQPYVETASLRQPTQDQLRAATNIDDAKAMYTQIGQIDPRVRAKTEQLIAGKTTAFDKAKALWQFFMPQNGFVYDTRTADATDADALADFILNGKRGFCEQYASAMAVMARVAGLPSRVAIGFTGGTPKDGYQSITSQDAHAWVEIYFGDQGWVSFDPTPLSDGRGVIPPYLDQNNPNSSQQSNAENLPTASRTAAPPTGTPRLPGDAAPAQGSGNQDGGLPAWQLILVITLLVLALAGTILLVLMGLRRRRHRARPSDGPSPGPELPTPGGVGNSALGGWLPLVTAGLWIVALGFLAAAVTWWFGLLIVLFFVALAGPASVRDFGRRKRLRAMVRGTPGAADAAWDELLAECADRGLPISESDTVRVAGQKVAQRHNLDDEGREGLRTVIGVVERSWYREDAREADPALPAAFDELRHSLRRNAPMSWRGRAFPRSLFRRR